MLTDPTTIDPTTTESAPPRPPRRRRALLLGATGGVFAIGVAAFAIAGGDSGPEPVRAAAPSTEVAQPSTTPTSVATASLAAGGSETDPVAPPSGALLSLAPASGLSFDVGTDELIMTVRNEGVVAASWETSLSSPAVSVSPSVGTLDPGAAVDVTVTADRGDLGNGVSHFELDVVSEAALAHGDTAYPVAVAVEKAEVMAAHAAPQVICALQSPGAAPKVAAILATGIHLEKADTIWAEIQTPGPKTSKAMAYDEAHDRWVATYSSTVLGAHVVSARAAGGEATGEPVGAVPINVIWCP